MRLLRELSRCLLAWNAFGIRGRRPQFRRIEPKKWPASVDLQASKKSKGLQEQQSHLVYFNTLAPHSLTISATGFTWRMPSCRINERRIRSIHGRKDPIKGQNSQEPRLRYFSVPAASRAIADNFFFAEDL